MLFISKVFYTLLHAFQIALEKIKQFSKILCHALKRKECDKMVCHIKTR